MSAKKIVFTLFSLLLSIVIFLMATEAVLRLSGWIFLKAQAHKNRQHLSDQAGVRIMCIGESTTALGGDLSYPSQLQRLLNKRFPDGKISVINQGVPGQGTNYILSHVEEWLAQYSPNIAIIMMGINDERQLVSIKTDKERNFFQKLHIHKLFLLLKHNFDKKAQPIVDAPPSLNKISDIRPIVAAEQLLANKQYDAAEKVLLPYWSQNPDGEVYVYMLKKLVLIYEETRQFEKLAGLFKHHLGKRLRSANDYMIGNTIEKVCIDNNGAAAMTKMITDIIESGQNQPGFYSLLASCYQKNGLPDVAARYQNDADLLYNSSVDMKIVESHLKLINILNQRGIDIVIMGYPRRSVQPLKTTLEKRIDIKNITFIDNKPRFDAALKTQPYDALFADRSAVAFGHCTPEGNRLIAENLDEHFSKTLK